MVRPVPFLGDGSLAEVTDLEGGVQLMVCPVPFLGDRSLAEVTDLGRGSDVSFLPRSEVEELRFLCSIPLQLLLASWFSLASHCPEGQADGSEGPLCCHGSPPLPSLFLSPLHGLSASVDALHWHLSTLPLLSLPPRVSIPTSPSESSKIH